MTATEHGVPPGGPADGAPPPRWGAPDLVVAFLVAQFASALGFALYASVKGVPLADLDRDVLTIGEIALLQAPLWLGLLGVPLLATRLRGGGARRDLGLWATWRDAPRGLEFLLLRNRLNVAISRAKHTAYLVHSPALLDDLPYTPEGVARLSGFARLVGRG